MDKHVFEGDTQVPPICKVCGENAWHDNHTKVTGPPKPPLLMLVDDDKLSVEWRSCLLRAARYRLLAMEGELERHRHLDSRYASAVIEATQMEMDCLQAGIAWLWRHPIA